MLTASPSPVVKVYVGLGSNIGDRAGYLLLAVRGMMDADLEVTRLSSIYETEPVEVLEQPLFLNMVAELAPCDALASPEQLLARLLRIEYSLGRRRDTPRGPRTIDLDLLLFGIQQRNSDLLTLPHPRLHQRRFVLAPLAELGPNLLHPRLHRTFQALLDDLTDPCEVRRWKA
jgi:2-amino-4-hydroxy-6-hydroxymethyldihydropteridine diphosphokinase